MSILGINWPCMHRECSEHGRNTVRVEYGDDAEHEVAIRLCDEHVHGFVEWFTEPGHHLRALERP